jgi:hypothetical protein
MLILKGIWILSLIFHAKDNFLKARLILYIVCPDLIELINSRISLLESLPVIRGYYLVLGGGKIGDSFLRYAKKAGFPFVLVIDADASVPASLNAIVLNDRRCVIDTIRSMAASQEKDTSQKPSVKKETEEKMTSESRTYFHRMDVNDVFSLLAHGLPEFIIPAVTSHAAADIVADALDFEQGGLVRKLSITRDEEEVMAFFESLVAAFPKNIVAGSYPEHGAIFFSYAQPGEICPDNCPGQESYCRTFSREKPRTITSYVREMTSIYPGQVFESYQMKPGIGGIKGVDLRQNLVSVMGHVLTLMQTSQEPPGIKDSSFFIATTCNCHGILTILQVSDSTN